MQGFITLERAARFFGVILGAYLVVFSFPAQGTLPPEAQAILNSLPEGKLSFSSVVRLAAKVSDSYRQLTAHRVIAESIRLGADVLTSSRAYSKISLSHDQTEGLSALSPLRTRSSRYSLGLETRLESGTALGFEVSHGLSEIKTGLFGDQNGAESRFGISLTQSLWKNAFGEITRAQKEGQLLSAKAQEALFDRAREDWALQIAELFYGAWLAQNRFLAADASVSRRQRLLKVVSVRAARGTSEKADVLQVKSALVRTRVQREQSRQDLGDRWRLLMTTLKLPDLFFAIDPAQLPISTESAGQSAITTCRGSAPQESSETRRLAWARDSASLLLGAARSEERPDLDLVATYGANSVDSASSETFGDLASLKYPAYSVGLVISIPLGFYAAKSRTQVAFADDLRARALLAQEQDMLRTQWRNKCLDLQRLSDAKKMLEEASAMLVERERLEEERFSLGRAGVVFVIQAGDDRSDTELQLKSTEAQLFLNELQIERMTGVFKKYLPDNL
jgi:outer membrane protein TolC